MNNTNCSPTNGFYTGWAIVLYGTPNTRLLVRILPRLQKILLVARNNNSVTAVA